MYKRNQPFSLDVITYGDTSIKTITLQAKCIPQQFFATYLSYSNMNDLSITKSKYDDLQSILKHVPEKYHGVYRSLKFDQTDSNKSDYALADQSSDED